MEYVNNPYIRDIDIFNTLVEAEDTDCDECPLTELCEKNTSCMCVFSVIWWRMHEHLDRIKELEQRIIELEAN